MRLLQTLYGARYALITFITGPQALAFAPAVALIGYWLGGEPVLLAMALTFPFLLILVRRGDAGLQVSETADTLDQILDQALSTARQHLRKTACLIVELDDFERLMDRHGPSAAGRISDCIEARLRSVLREQDKVCTLAPGQFGIVLGPVRRLDSDVTLQLATRLQAAAEEPIALDAATVYVSVSIGMCLDGFVRNGGGRDLADAAGIALIEARRHAPSAIRDYSPELRKISPVPPRTSTEVLSALQAGDITAWFQPQISTDTGAISGFEALARWVHPTRGMIPPNEFLPLLANIGKSDVLGTKMLQDSLRALSAWDAAGFDVERIGVNFSPEELRDPKLVDRVVWELDAHDLSPQRLTVEVLESVITHSPEDTITRNIRRLADLGCRIDLDDFGTGHASISSIRRFAVHRLKIDRSFVTKIDCDLEQQRMVNAIQLMAEQLNLETIAEGVETAGEHAMLGQLGCGHVQGFGIGRPMPFEKTNEWIAAHLERVKTPPAIGRNAG